MVDGGSPDDTCERARTAGADEVFVLETGGRPFQMNEGAARASQESEWLLFLHADTVLPGSGLSQIPNQPASVVGGAFQRRFDSTSWLLGLTAWISDFRSCRGIFTKQVRLSYLFRKNSTARSGKSVNTPSIFARK